VAVPTTDIFPDINIPVIAVGWTHTGLNPEEMEGRTTTVYVGRADPASRPVRPELSKQNLNDISLNFLRTQLVTVAG
jgi:hypothetical protein